MFSWWFLDDLTLAILALQAFLFGWSDCLFTEVGMR